ncbi:MAG: TauD/TfdA family dioxygenase [Rhodospirillaceae bacterium]|nr:TauD/TfdA family dioxygenase [Rhodospirillaceae bacterium]
MATTTRLQTRPLMPNFGVEIMGVDIAHADEETINEVLRTFHRHGAILLRNQKLTQADQLAFTKRFGEPEGNTRLEYTDPDFPEVYVISNKIVNGRLIGDYASGIGWHTDFSYGEKPALCTMLYSLEAPPEGSDTLLADLCAAWNALPPEKQKQVEGMIIHHSYEALAKMRGIEMTPAQKAALPDVFHPLVRRHPADGRKALWVSTGTVKGIVGIPNPEGLDLIDELVEFATQERFVYRHKWKAGDLLVWDNRCTLHTGTEFDTKKYVRHVHRTWVKGERPA